uniref:Secreted protein n=1 Tax=Caenorhabditis tropicalis TaxID=1561998 RepID=A0A1I7UPN9_9PELO
MWSKTLCILFLILGASASRTGSFGPDIHAKKAEGIAKEFLNKVTVAVKSDNPEDGLRPLVDISWFRTCHQMLYQEQIIESLTQNQTKTDFKIDFVFAEPYNEAEGEVYCGVKIFGVKSSPFNANLILTHLVDNETPTIFHRGWISGSSCGNHTS